MNVSEQLLKILTDEGVTQIFGVAGDALNPLVSALGKQDTVQWVSMKHEGNASYAAFAQGEIGGNFGVCASTVGPGALHLINGLYNAKKERSPVLAITGQVPVKYLGTNYHQEADLQKIYDDVCEYQAIVRSPEEAPRTILRAIRIALNKRCVCRIELPSDVAQMEAEGQEFVKKVFRSDSTLIPADHKLQQAALAINQAKTVGILAGAGCRGERERVLAFARKLHAPITHSLRACDIFDHATEPVVGLTGLIGNPSGYKAVMECELLLMLGTDFPYDHFLPKQNKVIQLDSRVESIGNRAPVDLGLHGEIGPTLEALLPLCEDKPESHFYRKCLDQFQQWKSDLRKQVDPKRDMVPVHPQLLTMEVDKQASADALFTIDTGTSAIWTSNFMNFDRERRVIGSFNHGSMAVALPAAIGAQLLCPKREVWSFVGDGAFNMTLHDFSTAAQHKLPLKLVVFNNSQLGFVKIEMEEAGLAPNLDALEVENFDFVEFARLTGGDGTTVEKADQVAQAVEAAKLSTKPFIINAKVNSGELSLPPRIEPKQAFNFGISKAKELFQAIKGDRRQWDNIRNEIEGYFD